MINRNVAIVFASSVGANAVSLLTIPFYLHAIGVARYGVVAFVWLIIGYFGLFILGLDKAILTLLAQHRHDKEAARSLFQTAAVLNIVTGCAGGLVLYVVGRAILAQTLGADNELRGEILASMPWIAACVPLATTTSLLIGALEAYQRFPALASTQFTATVLFQIIPILVARFIGPELTWVIPAAILSRAASTLWMLVILWPVMQLRGPLALQRRWVRPLISFGSAVSISGIVSPILTSLDRLFIAAMLGADAVSYYVVPSNFIAALQMVPNSLLRVLFPQLSTATPEAAAIASAEATMTIAVVVTPLVAIGILLAHPFLGWWIGPAFAASAEGVTEILLYGAWINCLAWVPFCLLTAQGRPGSVARLHVIEFPFFVVIVPAFVWIGGVHGAAIACSLRMAVDAVLLFRRSDLMSAVQTRLIWPAVIITAALATAFAFSSGSTPQLAAGAVIGALSLGWSATHLPGRVREQLSALLRRRQRTLSTD